MSAAHRIPLPPPGSCSLFKKGDQRFGELLINSDRHDSANGTALSVPRGRPAASMKRDALLQGAAHVFVQNTADQGLVRNAFLERSGADGLQITAGEAKLMR